MHNASLWFWRMISRYCWAEVPSHIFYLLICYLLSVKFNFLKSYFTLFCCILFNHTFKCSPVLEIYNLFPLFLILYTNLGIFFHCWKLLVSRSIGIYQHMQEVWTVRYAYEKVPPYFKCPGREILQNLISLGTELLTIVTRLSFGRFTGMYTAKQDLPQR